MYGIVVQPGFGISRDQLMQRLHDAGIDTRTFFCPMNQQPCLQSRPGFREVPCPVADGLWEKGLYLPSSYTLSEDVIKKITDAVRLAHRN
jgi:perosamine synthetase